MRKFLLLLSVLIAAFAAKAEVATITMSEQGWANAAGVSEFTVADIKFAIDKSTASTAPTYYTTGAGIRVYANSIVTVTPPADGTTVTKMVLTFASGYGFSTSTTVSTGTFSTATTTSTWEGSFTSTNPLEIKVGASNKHVRLQKVEVTYTPGETDPDNVAAPTINQLDDNMVELTAEEGTTIYYTTDETEPTNASTLYSAPFEITNETVVKAVAYNAAGKASSVATKTVKLNTFTSIADFVAAAPGTEAKLNTPLTAIYKNGTNLYVTDNKGGYMLVYNSSGISGDFPNGTVISYVKGTYNVSYKEIMVTTFGETSTGTEVEPETLAVEELASDMLYQYVKIENLNIVANASAANNYTGTDETGSVVIYNTFYNASRFNPVVEVPEGDGFTMYGFVGLFNSTIQITPIAFEGGAEKQHVATPTFEPETGTKLMIGDEITISCSTPDATIYYTTDSMTPSTLYTGPIEFTGAVTIRAYATKNGMLDSEIASATYDILIQGQNDVTFDFADAAKVNAMYTGEETLTTPTGASYNADPSKSTCISLTDKSFVNDMVTVNFSNGTNNSNPPVWVLYTSNSKLECRLYTGEYFTVNVNRDGYKITKIEIGQNTSSTTWSDPTLTANVELPATKADYWSDKVFTAPEGDIINSVKFAFSGTTRLASIKVTLEEDDQALMGIEEISAADNDAAVEYFNLQGIRVNGNNLPAGIYVRRQGTQVQKILVK